MDGSRIVDSILSIGASAFFGAAVIIAVAGLALGQRGKIEISVATMAIGLAPPGEWAVVADPTASAGRAIEQLSTDRTDYRFPLAIFQALSAKNVDIVIRFKAVTGEVDRAGGIAVRVISPDDYYVARANALEDNVSFYRVVKGWREQIADANIKVTAGAWHTLGLRAENEHFTVSFDGKTLYSASDRTISGSGRIALWTKADSVTRFDGVEMEKLP